MNACSLDSHAAFELDLKNVPEPIMLQIGDLQDSFPPYSLSIELPESPEIFAHAEYGTDIGPVRCDYQLLGTALTPDVPSYIELVQSENSKTVLRLQAQPRQGWPKKARHDIVTL